MLLLLLLYNIKQQEEEKNNRALFFLLFRQQFRPFQEERGEKNQGISYRWQRRIDWLMARAGDVTGAPVTPGPLLGSPEKCPPCDEASGKEDGSSENKWNRGFTADSRRIRLRSGRR